MLGIDIDHKDELKMAPVSRVTVDVTPLVVELKLMREAQAAAHKTLIEALRALPAPDVHVAASPAAVEVHVAAPQVSVTPTLDVRSPGVTVEAPTVINHVPPPPPPHIAILLGRWLVVPTILLAIDVALRALATLGWVP